MIPILKAAAFLTWKAHKVLMQEVGIDEDDLIQIGWLRVGRFLKSEEQLKYMFLNAKSCMFRYLVYMHAKRNRLTLVRIPDLSEDMSHKLASKDKIEIPVIQQLLELKQLTDRHKSILYYFYIKKHTLKEIGEILGISRERVRQLKREALQISRGLL
jgi:RNA polymerase sigma factor (sigma-70 family)